MTAAQWLGLILQASIFLTVPGLGLTVTLSRRCDHRVGPLSEVARDVGGRRTHIKPVGAG
jgi:hypothetical protein